MAFLVPIKLAPCRRRSVSPPAEPSSQRRGRVGSSQTHNFRDAILTPCSTPGLWKILQGHPGVPRPVSSGLPTRGCTHTQGYSSTSVPGAGSEHAKGIVSWRWGQALGGRGLEGPHCR